MGSPVVAVSPHLDDVALSCGGFVAAQPGSVMVTVFAGGPATVDPLPWWDEFCGVFEPGDDVVGARRDEDRRGAAVLSASVHHLGYWDHQYRDGALDGYDGPRTHAELAEAAAVDLERLVDELRPDRWLIPLGVFHHDHQATAAACQLVAVRRPEVEWLVYEDLPYAALLPEARQTAVDELARRKLILDETVLPAPTPTDDHAGGTRRRAVAEYRSQLEGLGEHLEVALTTDERIHALVRST